MVDRSTFHEPGSGDVAAERRRLVRIVEGLEAIERELDCIAEHRKALGEQAQHLAKRRKALLAEARDPQQSLAFDDEEPLDRVAAAEVEVDELDDDEPATEAKPGNLLPPKRRASKASKRAPKSSTGLDPGRVRWPDEVAGGDA